MDSLSAPWQASSIVRIRLSRSELIPFMRTAAQQHTQSSSLAVQRYLRRSQFANSRFTPSCRSPTVRVCLMFTGLRSRWHRRAKPCSGHSAAVNGYCRSCHIRREIGGKPSNNTSDILTVSDASHRHTERYPFAVPYSDQAFGQDWARSGNVDSYVLSTII